MWNLLLATILLAQDSKERALGEAMAAHIRADSAPPAMPAANAFVKRAGARLAPSGLTFELVNTPGAIEPNAIPGGHVFVPARFFLAANDVEEFVAMIAHAIGHTRQDWRQPTGWLGFHLDNENRNLIPLDRLEQQRAFEQQADAVAIDLLTRAGYPAAALRRYLARTQPEDTQRLSQLDARLANLLAVAFVPDPQFSDLQQSTGESLGLRRSKPPTLQRGPR